VREALLKLRPLDREVLILVYWDGLSHGDAASVLGCSVNAVASRVKKAKSRLEAQLSPRSSTMAPPHETSLPSTPKE
jgi:RNA polymerase sigma-70 factor (ECF subfamily)